MVMWDASGGRASGRLDHRDADPQDHSVHASAADPDELGRYISDVPGRGSQGVPSAFPAGELRAPERLALPSAAPAVPRYRRAEAPQGAPPVVPLNSVLPGGAEDRHRLWWRPEFAQQGERRLRGSAARAHGAA